MAGARLSMHKTREILRQKWGQGRSHREVARIQAYIPHFSAAISRHFTGGDQLV